ncbi:MAG: hypothetical protein ABI758_01245 [Candidatus Woesebacteria bacterium]
MIKTQPSTYIQSHIVLLLLSFICIVLAGLLIYQTAHQVRRRPIPVPRQTNVDLVQEWMTITYIGRTYDIPIPYLLESLAINPADSSKKNLKELAKERSQNTADFIESVKKSIKAFQTTPQ